MRGIHLWVLADRVSQRITAAYDTSQQVTLIAIYAKEKRIHAALFTARG